VIIFWLPIAIGVLLGMLSGGRISRLALIQLRHIWLLLGATLVQIALIFASPVPPEHGVDPLRVSLPLTTAAVGLFVVLNRQLPGMPLVLVGLIANLVVIVANGGLMPVSPEVLASAGRAGTLDYSREHPGVRLPKSKNVVLEWEETRLAWLSDAVLSPPLGPVDRRWNVSAGDLIIAAGLAYLTAEMVRRPIRPTERKEHEHGAADTGSHTVSSRASSGTSRWWRAME